MKKVLFTFSALICSIFLLSRSVSADSIKHVGYDVSLSFNNTSYTEVRQFFDTYSSNVNYMVSNLLDAYSTYEETYPYYWFTFLYGTSFGSEYINVWFYASDTIPTINSDNYSIPFKLTGDNCSYNITNDEYTMCDSVSLRDSSYSLYSNDDFFADRYFFSNFDLRFTNISESSIAYESVGLLGDRDFLQSSSSPVPSLYSFLELTFLNEYSSDTYTSVNLNDYAYLILSFKDYSNLISPVIFNVKGQLCLTAGYNYGMTPKENVTDRCSVVYDTLTPVRVYTSSNELQEHIVYYVKAYDTSISNIIEINTSVFNISYITSAEASEPTITVGGRPYSPVPYDKLPSTATQNESLGIIPGASCGIGDVNCYYENNGMDISNLFTHPLQLLQSVWSSITTMFVMIFGFFSLLPPLLQSFMISAFMLAVLLGIIKIIIG